jgi:hypothetical protein
MLVFLLFASVFDCFNIKALEKTKYLVLVRRNSDKALYKNYVNERYLSYDIRTISLEENKVPNKAARVKELLKVIKQNFDFSIAAFQYSIDYGYEVIWEGKKEKMDLPSDSFYTNLYDKTDGSSEFVLSRIVDSFLNVRWTQLKLASSYIEMAEPFRKFPYYNKFCPKCIDPEIDASIATEKQKEEALSYGFKVVTLYDTDSSIQPQFKPNVSLNEKNHKETLKNAFVFQGGCTWEPLNVFDNYKISRYKTLYRAKWADADENNVVDNYKAEIEVEEYESFANPDNVKRIAILGTFDPSNVDLEKLGKFFYAFIFSGNLSELLKGQSVGESVNGDYLFDISFGPPEATLMSITDKAKIVFEPQSIQDFNEIDMGYSSCMDLLIKNVGDDVLEWKIIQKPDWISFSVYNGSIACNSQEIVNITIISDIPNVVLESLPKQIVGDIVIETSDRNRSKIKIRIKAKGIFNDLMILGDYLWPVNTSKNIYWP